MVEFSSTQYNSISREYDSVNDLAISRALVINVERIISPHIKDAKVLELACGTGFFTRHMLDWGAASIVGVDVSEAMVDVAQADTKKRSDAAKCQFRVADCTAPFDAGHGQFDLVFAAWLLNYASDQAQMTAMFQNISKHLKPGGRLVTVTPSAEEDPMVCIDHLDHEFDKKYGYRVEMRKKLDVGYYVQLFFSTTPPVEFGNYFLPKSVYENAARAGGMTGKLDWVEILLTEDYDEMNAYMAEPVPKGYFDEWLKYPDFSILAVQKE